MTVPSKDHIVVRALLNVLDPSAEQLDACAKKPFVKLKKRGVNACAPAADDHRRMVGRPANIVVVERLSACTISVSWSDACSGRYTEQIWCSGLAHVAAVCALTGRAIHRGDQVFRPRTREVRVPPNRHQMILAATIGHRADLAIAGT
ncbi:DUF3331 domain-containing protein [Paraburkholderia kirstenboschensis]|uniref:DUF3331 domain-containing protein n=1 Tax=Paraburkholderia kirstenboschensis TaxID=1245436 RepID=A0ABZ0EPH6_9BURK|nr:DUF3331 domain-containing protein [Paraburkholderia kirstenboschensis]WOD19069.1 DUF3331 domain-containing protein [Paraburkholderia kirstenboschensis]